VSHYVRHDDPLDREAYYRGTSVYLVDRVIPMLPEKISNHLCSLKPDVDRLAMSVIAVLTPKGKVVDYRIEDTVIRSRMRLAYEEVQGYFEGDPEATRKVDPVRGTLDRLRRMANVLNGKREARGSLDFDLPSSRVLLDEEGLPVDIQKVVRLESNRLVEEFMLLANEIVARHLKEAKVPAVFRVHEEPKEKKLDDLAEQIGPFGYNLYGGNDRGSVSPKELQRVLHQAEDRPEEYIVGMLVLRSLMQARYDVSPLGHFGLALDDYTHYTSPIRRYPDLLVHRVLRMMSGKQKKAGGDDARYREWLVDAAVRSSERERLAESAERDSVELKKIQFMERHLGDTFEGVVSGVQVFGFFVELLKYHVSGLVHMNNLEDDYYEFWEEEFSLVGANTGRRFRLGDRVKVQVLAVNKELRQIDFLIEDVLEEAEPEAKRRRKARSEFEGKDKSHKPRSRIEERDSRRKGKGGGRGKKKGKSGDRKRGKRR
jgi:ribonuclease R